MTHNEMRLILDRIGYKNWHFRLGKKGEVSFLQVVFQAEDPIIADGWDWQKGRKWMLSEHMSKSELVQTALKAVLAAEEHEARENFRYMGQPVFGPHFDVNALWRLAAGEHTDERKPMPNEDIERPENVTHEPDYGPSPLAAFIERKGFRHDGLICAPDRDE